MANRCTPLGSVKHADRITAEAELLRRCTGMVVSRLVETQ